jgi:anthranilate synthase/aminodeoxychorismate synthase-like glutamine amidotransferase
MSSIVLIDNYDSFTYNLYQMVQALTDLPVKVYRNDALDLAGILALTPDRIILSPGPGHPGIASDFGVCKDVILSEQVTVPVLGVCLGHQGMAHHAGGTVCQAPFIVHGKTSPVGIIKNVPLFDGLSNPFQAMRYHSLVVDPDNLPDCLEVTAKETTHGLIMGLKHRTKPHYGVQFHPESIGTPEGNQLLQNFLEKC